MHPDVPRAPRASHRRPPNFYDEAHEKISILSDLARRVLRKLLDTPGTDLRSTHWRLVTFSVSTPDIETSLTQEYESGNNPLKTDRPGKSDNHVTKLVICHKVGYSRH